MQNHKANIEGKFKQLPSQMSEQQFIQNFGSIYEHSPWVAEQLWKAGIGENDDKISAFHSRMLEIVNNNEYNVKHTLILAHPDLAGKAAMQGELTTESTDEQASAGLDQCTPAELALLTNFNNEYKQKFGFPFIMAVKHSKKQAILEAFPERLKNSPEQEFDRAIEEIHKIALFRLQEI